MRTFSNNELKLMTNIVGVEQESLQRILYKFLIRHYEKVTYDEDFLLAEGDIPIALVAHMDTVFAKPAEEVYYDKVKNVLWSPTGLGADDRAGVFAILQIIKAGLRPHVIFTTNEEIGCIGAEELSYLPCPFKDLRYIIQLDRRNSNDCVFYNCENPEFTKYIESFGFLTAYGSFSDISELCPKWKVAGVNLSIGYRDEHTTSEILFVGQMFATIEKVKTMLTQSDIPSFKYMSAYGFEDYDFSGLAGLKYGMYYDFDEDELYSDYWNNNTISCQCCKCHKKIPYKNVLEVKNRNNRHSFICENCAVNWVEWCAQCGEPFEIDPKNPNKKYCDNCAKELK